VDAHIELSQGLFAIVDAADEVWAQQWKWHAHRSSKGTWYARRNASKGHIVIMHRALLGAPRGMDVDHKNRNGLDNRRANLRLASRGQNMANQRKAPGGTSRYKGVCWDSDRQAWNAKIQSDRKTINLGRFANESDAANAYNAAATAFFGEFARANEGLVQ